MALRVDERLLRNAEDGQLHIGGGSRPRIDPGSVIEAKANRRPSISRLPIDQLGNGGTEPNVVEYRRAEADADVAQLAGNLPQPLGLGGCAGSSVELMDYRC
jgi:hypothetical protein